MPASASRRSTCSGCSASRPPTALALLRRARLAAAALEGGGGNLQTLARIASRLAARGDDRVVSDFLTALDALLAHTEE